MRVTQISTFPPLRWPWQHGDRLRGSGHRTAFEPPRGGVCRQPEMDGNSCGTSAFNLVLNTWTQHLQRHIHLHAVMACGMLEKEGGNPQYRWNRIADLQI